MATSCMNVELRGGKYTGLLPFSFRHPRQFHVISSVKILHVKTARLFILNMGALNFYVKVQAVERGPLDLTSML